MDFTFTEEQQAAVEAAKAVFSSVTPDSVPSPALTAWLPSPRTSTACCGGSSPRAICWA